MLVIWLLSLGMEKQRRAAFKSIGDTNGFSLKLDNLAPKVLFENLVFYNQLKGIQFSNVLVKKDNDMQIMICDSVFNTSHSRGIRHTRTNFIFVNENFSFPDFAIQYVGKMDKLNTTFYENRGFQSCDFLPENYLLHTKDAEAVKPLIKGDFLALLTDDNLYVECNNYRFVVFNDIKRLDFTVVTSFLNKAQVVAQQLV